MDQVMGFGSNEHVVAQVDPTHKALRVSARPSEVGVYGSYSDSRVSGVMAAGLAAGSVIYAYRQTVPGLLVIPRRIRLTAGVDTVAFAQGATIFDLLRATAFATQYTNGLAITLAGKSGARATRMAAAPFTIANVAVGDIAVANTAALAAGGVAPVFDSAPMKTLVGSVGAVPSTLVVPQPGLLLEFTEPQQPLEIVQGEGFVIRATVPITGTWRFGVDFDFDVVDPSKYF